MAKKSKNARGGIMLVSTGTTESGEKSFSTYTTQKNRKNTTTRLELMKYDPFLRAPALFREKKS